MQRRQVLGALGLLSAAPCLAQEQDPFATLGWPELRREFLAGDEVRFDTRVNVEGPAFAEDPMNVPVGISAEALGEDVQQIRVIVDRNPIRRVLDFYPGAGVRPSLGLRFKLEQASPVRAAVRLRDGSWRVGGALVDSAGGGCTVPGQTRRDGSWTQHLGEISARLFARDGGARLRLRVMHPMDTGLAGSIPAFHLKRLALRDGTGRELMRMDCGEPLSENPVFSFDLIGQPPGPLRIEADDNNGNRFEGAVAS